MSKSQEYTVRIPDFGVHPSEQVSRDVDRMVEIRHQVVVQLIGEFHRGNLSNEGKVYVIYLLGQWRATEAISVLIDDIDLKAEKIDPRTAIARWGTYPAQEALSKIGTPAVHMILDRLPSEKDELRRKLMCFVISDAEGKRFGQILIRLRQDEESDAARKTNLDLALKVFDIIK